MQNKIFSFDSAKAIKAIEFGYYNAIHYLAPHALSGKNLCSHASPECIAHCLGWHSGQASMVKNETDINATRKSRLDKARRFMNDRKGYLKDVITSIENGIKGANKRGLMLCVRLNGSSDIAWEGIACSHNGVIYKNIMAIFPDIQFVDYTKNSSRLYRALPKNYYLTLSRHENNESESIAALRAGHNVAVIFANELPSHWNGFEVINGDEHDLRHMDKRGGVVVGLKAKGNKLKKSNSAFVVRDYETMAIAA